MNKLAFALLLIVVSNYSVAGWLEVIDKDKDMNKIDYSIYYDYETWRKKDETTKMWYLIDHMTEQNLLTSGVRYLSVKLLYECNCKEEIFRYLSFVYSNLNMGKGETVFVDNTPSEWVPIVPGTVSAAQCMIGCQMIPNILEQFANKPK